MDPLIANERDRSIATEAMRDTLARVARGAGVIWAVFISVALAGLRPGAGTVSVVLDVVCAAYALALARRLRSPASYRELHVEAYLLTLAAIGNNVISAYAMRDAHESFYALIIILGLGAVALDRLGSAIVALVGAAATVAVTARIGEAADIERISISLATSMLLGATIQIARRRHLRSLSALRALEDERSAELAATLERLEAELAERQKAEERRKELEEQLQQVKKLDALGTLAGGIAHDMNNVLAAIVGIAELGQQDQADGSQAREDFGHILVAAQRGASLTRNLLGFARRGKLRHEAFSLEDVVRDVVGLLERTTPKRVRFMLDLVEDGRTVVGDPAQVGQAVMNVCLNAIDAMPGEGTIVLRTARAVLAPGQSASGAVGPCAVLSIVDDGVGMDDDALAHAFEPFYSTKDQTSQHHSGLGLAMVYGTVRDHDGDVTLASAPSKGTTVTIRFPLTEQQVAKPVRKASTPAPVRATVLVVDDEPLVRAAVRRCLRSAEVTCKEVEGGLAAIEAVRADPAAFSLVILDLAMPGMGGAECFAELRAIDPAIPILVLSGFPKNQSIEELLAKGHADFMAKPFERAALIETVKRLGRRVDAAVAAG